MKQLIPITVFSYLRDQFRARIITGMNSAGDNSFEGPFLRRIDPRFRLETAGTSSIVGFLQKCTTEDGLGICKKGKNFEEKISLISFNFYTLLLNFNVIHAMGLVDCNNLNEIISS